MGHQLPNGDIEGYVTSKEFDDFKIEQNKKHDELILMMKPMSESYQAAVRLGKWIMVLLSFVSIMIGVSLGIIELLKRVKP